MRSAGFISIPAGDGFIRIAQSEHSDCRISMEFSDEVLTYDPGVLREGERLTRVALLPDPNPFNKVTDKPNPVAAPSSLI